MTNELNLNLFLKPIKQSIFGDENLTWENNYELVLEKIIAFRELPIEKKILLDEWIKIMPYLFNSFILDTKSNFIPLNKNNTIFPELLNTGKEKIKDFFVLVNNNDIKYIYESINSKYNFNASFKNNLVIKKNLELNSKLLVIGDTHGELYPFMQHLITFKEKGYFKNSYNFELQDNIILVITGDVIDFGDYGLDLLFLILLMIRDNIINNEDYINRKVFLLSGNHENLKGNWPMKFKYMTNLSLEYFNHNFDQDSKKKINIILENLPIMFFIIFNNLIFQFNHGAIPFPNDSYKINDNNTIRDKFYDKRPENRNKEIWLKIKNFLEGTNTNFLFTYNIFSILNGIFIGHNFSRYYDTIKQKPMISNFFLGKYLEYTGIDYVISGHQDLSAITFYHSDNNNFPTDVKYNDHLKTFYENNIRKISDLSGIFPIQLNLNKFKSNTNFRNLITSTASQTKELGKYSYIEITRNMALGDLSNFKLITDVKYLKKKKIYFYNNLDKINYDGIKDIDFSLRHNNNKSLCQISYDDFLKIYDRFNSSYNIILYSNYN